MKLMDISRPLVNGMPTWPGDTPFTYEVSWPKEDSGSVNVGKVTMSIHTGTHVDAPFHFDSDGRKIVDLDLNLYVGKARVIEISGVEGIGPEEFKDFDLTGVERLLIRTNSWENETEFPSSITYLKPELASFLAEKGIRLIGLDVPSVDPLDSKDLPAHHSLHQNEIHILEALALDGIEEGEYELMALPLRIEGADGSPVRALLRELKEGLA